jgi:hypothetical protein
MSTRDKLRQAKPKVTTVDTDHGSIHVRALSGAGRAAYFALVNEAGDGMAPMHKLAGLGLCEPDGTLAYDLDKPDDVAELAAVDGDVLQRICMALLDVSGLSQRAREEAEKKSDASPS